MKKFLLIWALVATFGLGYVVAGSQNYHLPLPWGYIEAGTNEASIVSTVVDPPKIRLASKGPSWGALSFNWVRPDGRQVETILIQGKQDERARNLPESDWRRLASVFTIHINDGTGDHDGAMKLVFELSSTGIWTPWTGAIGSRQ